MKVLFLRFSVVFLRDWLCWVSIFYSVLFARVKVLVGSSLLFPLPSSPTCGWSPTWLFKSAVPMVPCIEVLSGQRRTLLFSAATKLVWSDCVCLGEPEKTSVSVFLGHLQNNVFCVSGISVCVFKELPLYCSGGLRFFWDNKFDHAMVAFLDCVQQFKEEVEKGETRFCLPYR